jgi:3-(3-hydroxy-phenyl)propionate hydroxylase
MPPSSPRVLVVGAGPVGMVCALALNRRGVAVTVCEQEPAPVRDQRAATIHPPTLAFLDELGVTQKIIPLGLVSPTYRFHDRLGNAVVAEFDLARMSDEFRFPFVLQYEQYKLTASIAAEYANGGDFDMRFSHAVTALTQRSDHVDVEITTFDFGEVNSNLVNRNYFSDPDEWCNLFKVRGESPGGLWRAIFPLRHDEDDAEALAPETIEARLQKFFPKAGRYQVEYVNVYPVSQCVAATMRAGRILLAGDAAHVNNPIGGMGMNGGIHDAINLADKLARVLHGQAGEDLLDLYSRQRRHAAVKYIQQQTIANKRLMEERDPKVRAQNFDELRRVADDPRTSRQYMRRAALLDSLNEANAVT